jgi:hypothetical protein
MHIMTPSASRIVPVVLAMPAPCPGRKAVAEFWHRLARDLFDPYRPERHYMRGPGPKWQEKYGQTRH